MAIREELGECHRCQLSATRKNIVFGEGDEKARLVFVGEGPGYDEDATGRPFVGKAGQLLTRIITAIGMKRDEVYITNVVKCHPPQNRTPWLNEIARCYPFLAKQLQAIRPGVICALGNAAAQTLLDTDAGITAVRGTFQLWEGIKVMPTFHPAYLLRNPERKKETWNDMKAIQKELTGEI
jgi:DNA polymerase